MKSIRCAALGWHSWPKWRRVKSKRAADGVLQGQEILVRRCRRCGKRQIQLVDPKAAEAAESELRG